MLASSGYAGTPIPASRWQVAATTNGDRHSWPAKFVHYFGEELVRGARQPATMSIAACATQTREMRTNRRADPRDVVTATAAGIREDDSEPDKRIAQIRRQRAR
jgi:hypothetical protein